MSDERRTCEHEPQVHAIIGAMENQMPRHPAARHLTFLRLLPGKNPMKPDKESGSPGLRVQEERTL